MQSLQMRWPVPGHIGLSIMTSASAPSASPPLRSRCISEIFSSSGQPASGMPSGVLRDGAVLRAKALGARVLVALVAEHAVVDLATARCAGPCARRSARKPSRRRRRSVGAGNGLGQCRIRVLDLDEVQRVERAREAEDDHRDAEASRHGCSCDSWAAHQRFIASRSRATTACSSTAPFFAAASRSSKRQPASAVASSTSPASPSAAASAATTWTSLVEHVTASLSAAARGGARSRP